MHDNIVEIYQNEEKKISTNLRVMVKSCAPKIVQFIIFAILNPLAHKKCLQKKNKNISSNSLTAVLYAPKLYLSLKWYLIKVSHRTDSFVVVRTEMGQS